MRDRSLVLLNSQAAHGVRPLAYRRRIAALAATAALMMFAPLAHSQAQNEREPNAVEITPFFGWMGGGGFEDPATDAKRDIDADSTYGVFLNLMADVPERQYELFYAKQGTKVDGGAPIDLDIEYLQLGGTVSYPQSRYVHPYFGVTVGGARLSPKAAGLDDETKIAFSVGGGMRFPITQRFGLRLDFRAFVTLLQDDSEIFCVSDPANTSGCAIKPKGDTLVQYTGSLGVSFGF